MPPSLGVVGVVGVFSFSVMCRSSRCVLVSSIIIRIVREDIKKWSFEERDSFLCMGYNDVLLSS